MIEARADAESNKKRTESCFFCGRLEKLTWHSVVEWREWGKCSTIKMQHGSHSRKEEFTQNHGGTQIVLSGQPVSNFRLEINRDILISGIILEEFQSGIGLVGGKALIFWQSNDLTWWLGNSKEHDFGRAQWDLLSNCSSGLIIFLVALKNQYKC